MKKLSSLFKNWVQLATEVHKKGQEYNQSIENLLHGILDNETAFYFSPEAVNIMYTFSDLLRDINTS